VPANLNPVPIYEYQCEDCQKRSTIFFATFSAAKDAACEHCGSTHLRRLISLVAAVRAREDSGADLGSDDHGHGPGPGAGEFGGMAGGGFGDEGEVPEFGGDDLGEDDDY
jgi:putative FmdB family regulatory protein